MTRAWLVVLAAGALAAFVVLAVLVATDATPPGFDLALMAAAPALHGDVGEAIVMFVSRGLGGAGLVPASALITAWLVWRKRRGDAILFAVTMVVGLGLMFALKAMFERPRPEVFPWLDAIDGFSFPSGHTFNNTIFWLLVAVVVRRPWAWVLGIVMALMAGVFRVVCGVHWPSDVMAGWALGVMLVAAAVLVRERLDSARASAITAGP